MSFRRYIASTAREALDRVRRELGEDALVLSNKRLGPGRVEIVAAASNSMQALVEDADRPHAAGREPAVARERERPDTQAQSESFQDFIRRQSSVAPARATGVAMYHEVARVRAEPDASAPGAAPQREPLSVQPQATPAVFRQRTDAEAAPATHGLARVVAPSRPVPRATPAATTLTGSAAQATSSAVIAGSASLRPLSSFAKRSP